MRELLESFRPDLVGSWLEKSGLRRSVEQVVMRWRVQFHETTAAYLERKPLPINTNPSGGRQKAYTSGRLMENSRDPEGPVVLSVISALTVPLGVGLTEAGLTECKEGHQDAARGTGLYR
jgi:hypothetical protein